MIKLIARRRNARAYRAIVTEIKRLSPLQGDTIVVRCKREMKLEQYETIRKTLDELFPKNYASLVMVGDDMKFEVLGTRPSPATIVQAELQINLHATMGDKITRGHCICDGCILARMLMADAETGGATKK